MNLASAGLPEHRHDLSSGGPSDDGVVDHDQALPSDRLGQWIQLQLDATSPESGRRLDERPRDVAVLHQALPVRDGRDLGVPLRRRVPGVRDGDDQIGLGRRFAGQHSSHPAAHLMHASSVKAGIRAREVHELEEAERGSRRARVLE